MWKNKNVRLSVILGVLVVITGIQLLKNRSSDVSGVDRELFLVTDTVSINSIVIESANAKVSLDKVNNRWMLNKETAADEYYISLLKAVMASTKISRQISNTEQVAVENLFSSAGSKVHIRTENGKEIEFEVAGEEDQSNSYIRDPETSEIYLVNIPGYRSYVAGIYQLSPLEWEDKTLFRTPWTSLQRLSVDYPANPEWNFSIVPENGFLSMPGVEPLDTARMMEYVSIYASLKANYFLEAGLKDSLDQVQHLFEVGIADLDIQKNNRIRIYPLRAGATVQLGVDDRGKVFGFDYRNVAFLARRQAYFSSSENTDSP